METQLKANLQRTFDQESRELSFSTVGWKMFSSVKTRNRLIGFLFSLAVHAIAIWFLYGPARAPEAAVVVELEYFETPARVVKAEPSQPGSPRGTGKKISRRNLFPSSSPVGRPGEQSPNQETSVDHLTDHHIYNDATTDIFGENTDWSFLRYVHQKIDENLKFDSRLAQWNHFGNVFVEFWVDDQGRLLKDKIRVVADDPILKVHTLRALRRSLAESFTETKWNPLKESIQIKAKFSYLFGDSGLNWEKQRSFSKRHLVFQRATTEKPVPTDLGQHLASGGIHYDPFVMYERWEKYEHKKMQVLTEFDPFKDYREDPDYQL